jgi:30S ribosomal protein S31
MGKGDIRTAKGKRYARSYGNARPHGSSAVVKAAPTPKAPVAAVKKAAAKKKA